MTAQRYLIALGSNQRHHRFGPPAAVLRAALAQLPGVVEAAAPIIASLPVGPSQRRYANGAAILATPLDPPDLLEALKQIEHRFGRRASGQRWRARVLDLDLVLWSGGAWASPGLKIPHIAFRTRAFVLGPAAAIAPRWRDPLTGLSLRQLRIRLARHSTKPLTATGPAPKRASGEGP